MTSKRVAFTAKPSTRTPSPDEWVSERVVPTPPTQERQKIKRLTIDIPEDLHRRLKMDCAGQGIKMADAIRDLLLQKYGIKENI